MKAEDVMKALEWCSDLRLCVDCPMRAEGYFSHSGNACRQALMKNALALLREKDAEIERLQKHNTEMARKHYQDGRTEAITEFAERLKEKMNDLSRKEYLGQPYFLVRKAFIDRIEKELKGEQQ